MSDSFNYHLDYVKKDLEKIIKIDDYSLEDNKIVYKDEKIDYLSRVSMLFQIINSCSFEPDALCDCRDFIEYTNILYTLDKINLYLFNNNNSIFELKEQNVLYTDQTNIFDYSSIDTFKQDNFQSKFVLEKKVEVVDFQNEKNIDFIALIYFHFIFKNNYSNLTSYFIASFLKQIIKYKDNNLIIYDIPVIYDLTENEFPFYFSLFFMKKLYQFNFITVPIHCYFASSSNDQSKRTIKNYHTENNTLDIQNIENIFNLKENIKILCKNDFQLLSDFFLLYPSLKKNYKIYLLKPKTKYYIIYQNLLTNKLHSFKLSSMNSSESYLVINIQNFRIFYFDKRINYVIEIVSSIILLILLILYFSLEKK